MVDSRLAQALEALMARRRIPRAAYRMQFHGAFTFRDALPLVGYLDELGISDCYPSPLMMAAPESTHGYDICSHDQLNPELGGEEGFARFSEALRRSGMGLLLDIVPNHMGIASPANAWWMDVLENGPASRYANFFDIDWQPMAPELRDKVLLPILEDQYGDVLEKGKLRLEMAHGAFFLIYHQFRLPVAPQTYGLILNLRLHALRGRLGDGHEHLEELLSILTEIGHLPPRRPLAPEALAEYYREKEVIKRRLNALCQVSPPAGEALAQALDEINGRPGEPHSFDRLDELIDAQSYRPAYWRVAMEEINYRRFFDINMLAAIRVELPEVFDAVHRLVLRLLGEGAIAGVRVDHLDGLWDPPEYLRKLQIEALVERLTRSGEVLADRPALAAQVGQWFDEWMATRADRDGGLPLYVVAEKILSGAEPLAPDWPVEGTTGYDFLNIVNGLFVDGENRRAFDKIYSQFIGRQFVFRELLHKCKKKILQMSMAGELNALSMQLDRIVQRKRCWRDFTLNSLTSALREIIAALPVYRTYINHRTTQVSPTDRQYLEDAVRQARLHHPVLAGSLFDFLCHTILLENRDRFTPAEHASVIDFIMKFQQATGPVMAKGFEDTACYIYNRLASLNEVGGSPERFGLTAEEFHQLQLDRRRLWPHTLLATATHDTKRGEDVRARINVLSEIPAEWRAHLSRWSRRNGPRKQFLHTLAVPEDNMEYLLYQTLVGAWPEETLDDPGHEHFIDRIVAYMRKAAREAKIHTSWINVNAAYEDALERFVRAILEPSRRNGFLEDLKKFARRVAFFGRFNALSQLLLKLTAPGVPDFYQGCELWDLRLVDPDNRQPVDYDLRRALVRQLHEAIARAGEDLAPLAGHLLSHACDGRVKLFVMLRLLALRRERPELFAAGAYEPLHTAGARSEHIIAFARRRKGEALLVVVPRLMVKLVGGHEHPPLGEAIWKDTSLLLPFASPDVPLHNVLTGERLFPAPRDRAATLPLARLLARFPVAALFMTSP